MVSQIRQDILIGVFLPGDKMQLNELKQRYGVGGTPIREALMQLVWQNFVVMEPQKGFRVAPVTLEELKDILDTRRVLEGIALEKSFSRGDETWELSILAAYHRLSRVNLEDPDIDYTSWGMLHMNFHLSLISACESPMLLRMIEIVHNQLERYRHIWLNHELDAPQRYHDDGEHRAIMNAVMERNLPEAMHLLEEHHRHVIELAENLTQENFASRIQLARKKPETE
ncbi:GntR family transcriptional regulator [Paludibacterium paludis]|uniref:GntR family transcriptional regulator n=2 Tax=Paludibacterium paludis TaxID=1225769 RepID=A0A918P145_9NEIS|nr:FCD domain-containing protein [Paludibacterium paludis]GGY11586.1 GntR family transcriptional regulator [Paludibacterium paludis]